MGRLKITVDHTQAAPGIITSQRALDMLNMIESCGGVTEDALAAAYRKSRQLLSKLRGAGAVYRVVAGENVLWMPTGVLPPNDYGGFERKLAVGWLAVRMVESGGHYENGSAVFPNGAAFRVEVAPPLPTDTCLAIFLVAEKVHLGKGSIWVILDELRRKTLKECLRT